MVCMLHERIERKPGLFEVREVRKGGYKKGTCFAIAISSVRHPESAHILFTNYSIRLPTI